MEMMNISFDEAANPAFPVPVTSYLYRDMSAPASAVVREAKPDRNKAGHEKEQQAAPDVPAQDIDELLNRARTEAAAEIERRLRAEYEARAAREAAKITQALDLFVAERKSYFSRVESDVVHLALAIASKILHREAQVDPLLVAALVRVAVDKLHDGSSVSVRTSPENAEKWREYLASSMNGSTIAIIEDAQLSPEDCILETDLGSANFSIDAQLKEVEQGFFDLLAQRPAIK
jgi:flagellar assembly protein FliH